LEAIDPYSVSDRWWSEASTVFEECIDSGWEHMFSRIFTLFLWL
jgi:hypothetical protein